MQTWNTLILQHKERHTPLVLVTLMHQVGSAPRTAGARMLVLPDGSIEGTIGGGKYEADAITAAVAMMNGSLPLPECTDPETVPGFIMEFSLRGVTDMDMVCGGALTLLLEFLPSTEENLAVFSRAKTAEQAGQAFTFITQVNPQREIMPTGKPVIQGTSAVVKRHILVQQNNGEYAYPEGLPAQILEQARTMTYALPLQVMEAKTPYVLEFFPRPSRLFIFGAGHVSLDVARLASSVDFATHVVDDRPEFASPERFPFSSSLVLPSLAQATVKEYFTKVCIQPQDGIVIVTRGHAHDKDVLAAALGTAAGYIGMIGSKTKRQQVYNNLLQNGFTETDLQRVHSPIGLSIGAETPQEIAVSIVAELIQWKRSKP